MIPNAVSRPHVSTKKAGKLGRRDHLIAQYSLALTRGESAFVILKRGYSSESGRVAKRVARAWNRILDEAEIRHQEFWENYDGN